MDNTLQNGINGEEHHPPREQLLLYVDRELTPKGAARIEKHLGVCWSCRARVSKIEKFIADFMEFDGAMLTPSLSYPPNSWRGFNGGLRQITAESGRRSLLSIVFSSFGGFFSRARHLVMPRH
jgi:predicted anti-sigma-YlaC factor YlaD